MGRSEVLFPAEISPLDAVRFVRRLSDRTIMMVTWTGKCNTKSQSAELERSYGTASRCHCGRLWSYEILLQNEDE